MSISHPGTGATNCNRSNFLWAREATTYDNLLLDGRISNADVRDGNGSSGLHMISGIGRWNKEDVTEMLLFYLLTCDPPADVNGRNSSGRKPMWLAALYNNTSAVKVLIDFGGDRTIKSNSDDPKYQKIKLLMECFRSEE